MKLNDYQTEASKTADYEGLNVDPIVFLGLALSGETGEITEKIKKALRNDGGVFTTDTKNSIMHELGDVLWYVSQMSKHLGFSLEEVANYNLKKLESRYERGVIKSEGDER